ncbi:UDP-2,3-diacylglucosamine diphosphatase [Caulobacter hibisci]|uniref:UDP-2,3-diacylglucosamine diphosphatase LpxI n=1 Tax=Caulobacter hibisci TaxID=2035993 RepID=A0ABS0SU47_9CAUL|nr:UDP-2,3-diacylglucosamine diphosphatase LpxI [Caulobacter hibisci]MBI1683149.1 UDP-2,3-diacylglucosamine diphosphatase LpxI [Caulobacter hibisci]
MRKLGLIAGGGALPIELAAHCERADRPFAVMRLKGFADTSLEQYAGIEVGLAEFGKAFKALKDEGCEAVCFAGTVDRPDFSALIPDFRGVKVLPGLIKAAREGDDALLRRVLTEFEKEGFVVEGAHEVRGEMTLPIGPLGRHAPLEAHGLDIDRALTVARAIGALDVGQGAVVCDGLVLAVEAQEGTDAMLRRVADLPQAIRGRPEAPKGVLAKAPKPIQETKVDLPTIGVATIQRAARAGLAGVVGETGRLLIVDRDQVIACADDLGLFVYGVEPR